MTNKGNKRLTVEKQLPPCVLYCNEHTFPKNAGRSKLDDGWRAKSQAESVIPNIMLLKYILKQKQKCAKLVMVSTIKVYAKATVRSTIPEPCPGSPFGPNEDCLGTPLRIH
jgi:hypothetical protein